MRQTVGSSLGSALAVAAIACARIDPGPLLERATDAYHAGRYVECGGLFERALDAGATGPTPAYNGACCRARADDAEGAFRLLHEAARRGYRKVEWVERDEDLASLRADPRWIEVVRAIEVAREEYLSRVNRELVQIYEEDQADRDAETIDWAVVGPRDAARVSTS